MVGLGIDLGTPETVTAVRHDDGRIEIVQLDGAGDGGRSSPAVDAPVDDAVAEGGPSAARLDSVIRGCRARLGSVDRVALAHPVEWPEAALTRYREVAGAAGAAQALLVARTLAAELGAHAAMDAPPERLVALGAAAYLGTEAADAGSMAAGTAVDGMAAGTAVDGMAAGTAVDGMAAGTAVDGMAAGTAVDGMAAGTAIDDAFDRLGSGGAVEAPARPAWLLPAVVGAVIAVAALVVVLLLLQGGEDDGSVATGATVSSEPATPPSSATTTLATSTTTAPRATSTRPTTTTTVPTTASSAVTTTVAPSTPTTAVYDLVAAAGRNPAWVATPVPLGADARAALLAFGSLWVSMHGGNDVWRIDPATLAVQARIPTGAGPLAMVAGELGLWVGNAAGDTVAFVDPATNELGPPLLVGAGPGGLAAKEGRVWVTVAGDQNVAEIDEAHRQVVIESEPLGATPGAVTVAGDSLVVSSAPDADPVWRIGIIDLAVVSDLGEPGGRSSAVAASGDEGSVFIGYDATTTLTRVDLATGAAVARAVLPGPPRFVVTPDAVWVAPLGTTALLALDPVTLATIAQVDAGRPLTGGFAVGGDGIYLLDTPDVAQPSQLVKLTPADSG